MIIVSKLNRTTEAHLANETADVGTIYISNIPRASDFSAFVLVQRKLGCLTNKATTSSSSLHREIREINCTRYLNGRASTRPNLAHNAASAAITGLNRGSWDIAQSANAQGSAILDLTHEQTSVAAARLDRAA